MLLETENCRVCRGLKYEGYSDEGYTLLTAAGTPLEQAALQGRGLVATS